ncbi:MAG: copper resistance protein CopC, partial [Acidimicrobiaceae bacterium]
MRRVLSLAVLATAFVVMMSPSTASAHAVLDSSTPGPSTVVKESPDEIVLDFSETIENSLLSIRLFDSEQIEVNIGDAQRSSTDQSQATADVSVLDDGVYVV